MRRSVTSSTARHSPAPPPAYSLQLRMEWLCVIGLLLVGCSVSLGQPINMVFMLMDDVSLTSKEGGGREE